jgi:hypothetical protein
MIDFFSKLYDGHGKHVKWLVHLNDLKKINQLDQAVTIPVDARARWTHIWLRWFVACLLLCIPMAIVITIIQLLALKVNRAFDVSEYIDMLLGASFTGFFLASLAAVFTHRTTWKSRAVAMQTMAKLGYCPHCGYIIRDTPPESDGCVPCSECGHAWVVEPRIDQSADA